MHSATFGSNSNTCNIDVSDFFCDCGKNPSRLHVAASQDVMIRYTYIVQIYHVSCALKLIGSQLSVSHEIKTEN